MREPRVLCSTTKRKWWKTLCTVFASPLAESLVWIRHRLAYFERQLSSCGFRLNRPRLQCKQCWAPHAVKCFSPNLNSLRRRCLRVQLTSQSAGSHDFVPIKRNRGEHFAESKQRGGELTAYGEAIAIANRLCLANLSTTMEHAKKAARHKLTITSIFLD
jgi:hypothetical protein